MNANDKPSHRGRVTGRVPGDCAAVLVYTTFPSREAAETAGRALVEGELAGCINILAPMVAIYRWQGVTERAEEAVLIAKTSAAKAEACMEAILAAHPYDTPAVLALPVAAGAADYIAWILAGTGGGRAS